MLGQRFVMHSNLSVGRQGALAHGDKVLLRQGESDETLREECRQCLDAVSMIPPGDARYQQLRLRAFGE